MIIFVTVISGASNLQRTQDLSIAMPRIPSYLNDLSRWTKRFAMCCVHKLGSSVFSLEDGLLCWEGSSVYKFKKFDY